MTAAAKPAAAPKVAPVAAKAVPAKPVPAAATESPDDAVEALLADAESHLQKKICIECYEEGFDPFCAQCGGKMINMDDGDEDVLQIDEDDDLNVTVTSKKTESAGLTALDRLEGILKASPQTTTTTASAPTAAAAAATAKAAAAVPASQTQRVPAAAPAAAVPLMPMKKWDANDPGSKEKVFIIDLGTEYVKYGFSNDAEASRIRACVDGRANQTTTHYTVKGQVFPFDGSESAFQDNAYLVDLLRKVVRAGAYSSDCPLILTTCVQNHLDGPGEWLYALSEGEILERVPPLFYLGYSPLFSLMSALDTIYPTGIVVDIGASGVQVVPVYTGSKLDHAIQSHAFGGRIFQEFLLSRVQATARDEQSVSAGIRDGCFAALNFTEEMQANGYEVSVVAVGQTYRGWKVKNAKLEKRVTAGVLSMGIESFAAVELYFTPSLIQKFEVFPSIQQLVRDCVSYSPKPIQLLLLQNVVVSGDAARFRGFPERLGKELRSMYPSANIQVTAAAPNSAWKGAKLFASRSTFTKQCTNATDLTTLAHASHRFF